MLGWDGGVLPARVGRSRQADPGEPGPVLPDLPQRQGLPRVLDQEAVQRLAVGQHPLRAGPDLHRVVAHDLHEHPAVAARERRHRGVAVGAPDHLDDAPVQPLCGGGSVRQDRRGGVAGVGHRGVAQRDHHLVRGVGHQAHGRPEDHAQGALGAGEEPRDVEAPLGQQVLQAVARHLAAEAAELGPDGPQIRPHDRLEGGEAGEGGDVLGAVQQHPLAAAGQDVERDDVVGGAPVAQRARPAGVVADHPADGAAVVGRGVGPEAQPVRGGGHLEGGLDDAGLHRGRPGLRVERGDGVEVAGGVEHQPRPDGVAGTGGPRATGGDRHAHGPGRVKHGHRLLDRARVGHGLGDHPVQRCVGGVERPGELGGVQDVRDAATPQLSPEVTDLG